MVVDALGNPLRVILSAGQIADIECAAEAIEHLPTQAIIADKGYDADHFVAVIEAAGAQAVIPPRSNRLVQRHFDRHLYKDRNLIERFFARIKHFRRIATRYDKLAISFLSFIHLSLIYALCYYTETPANVFPTNCKISSRTRRTSISDSISQPLDQLWMTLMPIFSRSSWN